MSKTADLVYERKQFFVPYNGKIADIAEADALKHFLTLANTAGTGAIAGETRKIITVWLSATRVIGTGMLFGYSNEGVTASVISFSLADRSRIIIIKDGTQRLQYAQSVANDDWDLYCLGYVVES